MRKKHPSSSKAQREDYVNRILDGMTPTNGDLSRTYLTAKLAEGIKSSSRMNSANTFSHFDRHLNGRPFNEATPEQVRDFILACQRSMADYTVWGHAARLRAYYRWASPTGELTRELRMALKRRAPQSVAEREPITEAEFRALLGATNELKQNLSRVRAQAILWFFWDSGFRLGEMLALEIRDVKFDDKGGARITLRPQPEGLKTGPRSIYVVECVGALRTWLGLHPAEDNPEASLITSGHEDGTASYWPENVYLLFERLRSTAGIRGPKGIRPHLFRHTRATRAARAGWNESQMRNYFGWSADSTMPSVYIHLAERDMEERVRRDAGVDEFGNRVSTPALDDAILDKRLKLALRRLLTEPDEEARRK